MEKITLEEVVIAGLLHDIGKFAQRADVKRLRNKEMDGSLCPSSKGGWFTHVHVSYTWAFIESHKDVFPEDVNAEVIRDLASYHHNPRNAGDWLIAHGDRLSSGSDRRSDKELDYEVAEKFYEQPMIHIVSMLSFPGSSPLKLQYVRMAPLEATSVLPVSSSKIGRENYQQIWTSFEKEFLELKGMTARAFISALDSLLERYLWCIPSTTVDDPDISLYHHSKTTAAFASSLFQLYGPNVTEEQARNSNDNNFLLVQGDVSGIQSYIFDLKSAENSAKLLRARSFQILMQSLTIAQNILKDCGLTDENLISFAGGHFLLLLPNLESVTKLLSGKRANLEKFSFEQYGGRLCFLLSHEYSANDYLLQQKGGRALQAQLQLQLDYAKKTRFQKEIMRTLGIQQGFYGDLQRFGACSCCGAMPATEEGGICHSCKELIAIGRKLPKAKEIVLLSDDISSLGKQVSLHDTLAKEKGAYTLNAFVAGYPRFDLPYQAPVNSDGESLLSFEEIADLSDGNKKLAMFKADVDNLGLIFASSLGVRWSLSRYASLSSQIQFFFSAYLRDFIVKNPACVQTMYVVYSGGDDVCIVGPWNVICSFANEFHTKFSEFTSCNPDVTLSAGIALADAHLPIGDIAKMAEDALDCSKQRSDHGTITKNSITVFDRTLTWEEYHQALEDGKKIGRLLQERSVSTSSVYKIIDYSERAHRTQQNDKFSMNDAIWSSSYRYHVTRNIPKEERNWFYQFGVSAHQMGIMKVAASYGLYLNR